MSRCVHVLVSSDGLAPPRWLDAFPNSVVQRADALTPQNADVVWLWVGLDTDISDAVAPVLRAFDKAILVVLTSLPSAAQAIVALQLGAKAYLNAHAHAQVLVQVQNTVLANAVWLGADLVEFLSAALHVLPGANQKQPSAMVWRDKLTEREQEVASMIGRGLSNKLVARDLDITERTVKAHLTSIFAKLNVSDRLQLALLVSGQD